MMPHRKYGRYRKPKNHNGDRDVISEIYDRLRRHLMARHAYNRTMVTLGRLDARSLQDIGVSRCDIPRLACEAAVKVGGRGRSA